jgi:hypothetical protein
MTILLGKGFLVWCGCAIWRGGMLCGGLFGGLLDAGQVVGPESIEFLDPVVHRFEFLRVEAVEAALAGLLDGDDAHFSQDAQVLGDGGLGETELNDDFGDVALGPLGEEVDDLPPTGFGDGVEDVGGCGCASHWPQYIPIWEYVKENGKTLESSRARAQKIKKTILSNLDCILRNR